MWRWLAQTIEIKQWLHLHEHAESRRAAAYPTKYRQLSTYREYSSLDDSIRRPLLSYTRALNCSCVMLVLSVRNRQGGSQPQGAEWAWCDFTPSGVHNKYHDSIINGSSFPPRRVRFTPHPTALTMSRLMTFWRCDFRSETKDEKSNNWSENNLFI